MTTVHPTSSVQMERRCPIVGCLCFLLFAILGIVAILTGFVLYDQFDQLFGDTVRQQMEINDDTFWWYQRWLNPPVHQTLTVHVFQVENWAELRDNWLLTINETYIQSMLKAQQDALNKQRQQEILRRLPVGSRRQVQILPASTTIKPIVERSIRPRVREIGPFVFRIEQWKEQVNYTDQTKQQLSYEQRTRYYFEPLLSYEDLQLKVIVANAELSALNPFIRSMLKRAQSVARISQSLRMNIEQILQLYALNMFVERTIGQVIFGSTFEIKEGGGGAMEELGGGGGPPTFIGNQTNNDNLMLNASRLANGLTKDMTVNRILTLYDRVEPYLKRLGVTLDPYQLLSGAYKYEVDQRRGLRLVNVRDKDMMNSTMNLNGGGDGGRRPRQSKLLGGSSSSDPVDYRDNFVWSFFTNDTREKLDIFTGVETNRNGEIIRWNQQTFMDDWYARWCNTINGTDGRQYQPFLRSPRIYDFAPRICRSLPMKLSDLNVQATPSGIRLRRYTKADDFMQSPYKNKNNGCFCRFSKQPKRCNYDGILDLANCYHGAPIILTNPHFSGKITRSIEQSIDGLTPDDSLYQTQIDVEPVSGIVLEKLERFQFNVHLQPMPLKINSTHYLPELIVPLMWYQERLQASKEYQQSIKYLFVYPMRYQEYGVIGLILLGMFLAFIGIISAFVCCCTHKPVKMRAPSKGSMVKSSPPPPPITVQTSTPPKHNPPPPPPPPLAEKQPPLAALAVVGKSSEAWAEPKPSQTIKPFDIKSVQSDEEILQLFPDNLLQQQLFANVEDDYNPNQIDRSNGGKRIMKYGLAQTVYPKQPVVHLITAPIPAIVQQRQQQQQQQITVVPVVQVDSSNPNPYSEEEAEGSGYPPTAPLPPEPKSSTKLRSLAVIKSTLLGKLNKKPQQQQQTSQATAAAMEVTPIQTIKSKTTWANQKPSQQLSISELFPPANIDVNVLKHVLHDDDDDDAVGRQFPEDNIYEEAPDMDDDSDIHPIQDTDTTFIPLDPEEELEEEENIVGGELELEAYDDDDDEDAEDAKGSSKDDPSNNPSGESVKQEPESKEEGPAVSVKSAASIQERWRLAKQKIQEEKQKQHIYLSRPVWPTRRDLIYDLPQYILRTKDEFVL